MPFWTPRRNELWRHLTTLLRERRVPRDVKIGIGAGVKHSDNMLRYCMVPTLDKFDLDPTPFFSEGFRVPPYILNEAKGFPIPPLEAARGCRGSENLPFRPPGNQNADGSLHLRGQKNGRARLPIGRYLSRIPVHIQVWRKGWGSNCESDIGSPGRDQALRGE